MMVRREHARAVLALEQRLGESSVRTDEAALVAASRDESEADVVLPSAVVVPQTSAEIAAALKVCAEFGVAVVPRGAGTGRTGGAAVVVDSIVIDTTKLDDVKGIERQDSYAVVDPGVVTGVFHERCEGEGLFYPPDPQSSQWCTLGGNVAENAGGPRALAYGVTRDYVLGLRAVTMEGEELVVGRRTAKGVTGYDVTSLLVGSEGTLAVFTELWLRVIVAPPVVRTLLATFASVYDAGRAVEAILRAGIVPRCIELLDELCCASVRETDPASLPTNAQVVLIIEVDGDEARCDSLVERTGAVLDESQATAVLVAKHGGDRERLWAARRVLSRALRRRATHKLSEDIVVPRSKLALILDDVRAISEREGLVMPTYGHAGDGNLHVNLLWNTPDERPRVDRAIRALFEQTILHGGTLSGEHGIGVLKRDFLPLEQSPALIAAQRAIKLALDPRDLLNPHKVLPRISHHAC
jgi:glycolate oxidase